jgi:hypothetical protein
MVERVCRRAIVIRGHEDIVGEGECLRQESIVLCSDCLARLRIRLIVESLNR